MTAEHVHDWKYAPDWDRKSTLKAGYRAMECVPCRAVIWVSPPREGGELVPAHDMANTSQTLPTAPVPEASREVTDGG